MKLLLMGSTGFSKDALHIHVGLAVFLGSALLFRWLLTSVRPLLAAAAVALAGEAWDMVDNLLSGAPMQLAGHWHDIWNTLFWPAVILLLARATPMLKR